MLSVQLTKFTDLGFRILMRLTVPDTGTVAPTTQVIADQVAVSYTHATKVVTRLRDLGVVEARRGRNGGLSITDLGRTVSVGWLARELEGGDEVIECDGTTPCPLRADCRFRSILRTAQEAFFAALDPYTLADLTHSPTAEVLLSLTTRPRE